MADITQKYTLHVTNNNMEDQHFGVYLDIGNIDGPSVDPLQLAWITGTAAGGSPSNPDTSTFTWFVTYGIAVMEHDSEGTLDHPRFFDTARMCSVALDKANVVNITYDGDEDGGAVKFVGTPGNGTTGEISLIIDHAPPSLRQQQADKKTLFMGLTINNNPAAAFPLEPNTHLTLTPELKYYIIAGKFKKGQLVNTAQRTNALEITYGGATTQSVVFGDDNVMRIA